MIQSNRTTSTGMELLMNLGPENDPSQFHCREKDGITHVSVLLQENLDEGILL